MNTETRIIIAVAIVTIVALASIVGAAIALRRRHRRKLRRRGIKTYGH